MKKNETASERAVLVTTQHKGVFFGYATQTDGSTIRLRAARLCVYLTGPLTFAVSWGWHPPVPEAGLPHRPSG